MIPFEVGPKDNRGRAAAHISEAALISSLRDMGSGPTSNNFRRLTLGPELISEELELEEFAFFESHPHPHQHVP